MGFAEPSEALHSKRMNFPFYIGSYYRFLGWLSIGCTVVSLLAFYWIQHVHVDFSFLIWLWLGRELKEKKNTARKWAIGISIFILGIFVLAGFLDSANATSFGGKKYASGTLGFYVVFGVLFIMLVVPGIALLHPKAKQQFTK